MTSYIRQQGSRIIAVLLVLSVLQGCSVLTPASNDARIEKTASAQYVISTRPEKLDLSQLNSGDSSTVMSLVSPVQYNAALRSNGNSLGGPMRIDDPSAPIMSRLGDFFQKKYDLKFVARGVINNLDPNYLNSVLNQGEYVIDVRVSKLKLVAQSQGSLFYLTGAYQFSVIDHRRGRTVLQDECAFSDIANAQSVRYFSARGGQNISSFLDKYATPCLRYFALGEPLPGQAAHASNSATQTAQATQNSASSASASYTHLSLGSGLTFYGDVGTDGTVLKDLNLSWALGKKLTNTNSFITRTTMSTFEADAFPSFSTNSFYGASLGFGTLFHIDGDYLQGVEVLVSGRISQTLQSDITLSTNALSLDVNTHYRLIGPLLGLVQYSYIRHLGQAEDTRAGGHRLGVSLAYKFDL